MDQKERQNLRNQLGLERSQWETAVELRFFYNDIRDLPDLNERLSQETFQKTLTDIARELYGLVLRPLGLELLDKKRHCMWLWDRWVSLPGPND